MQPAAALRSAAPCECRPSCLTQLQPDHSPGDSTNTSGVAGLLSLNTAPSSNGGGSTKRGPSTSPTKPRAAASTLSGRRQRSTRRRWKGDRREAKGSASGSSWACG